MATTISPDFELKLDGELFRARECGFFILESSEPAKKGEEELSLFLPNRLGLLFKILEKSSKNIFG